MILETLGALVALATANPAATRLPGTVAGNVVILTPEDRRHRRLRVLVDSGGYDLIDSSATGALRLRRTKLDLGGKTRYTVAFPDFVRRAIPAPKTAWLVARPGVIREGFAAAIDATLGTSWLVEHAITVDYPKGSIELARTPEPGTPVPLTVAVGRSTIPSLPPTALATIDVSVAGETLTLLLDTGATARVRSRVKSMMPDAAPVHQVCLIETTLLSTWHRMHPEWKYVDAAFDVAGDPAAAPAILVPDLRLGPARALPTWFVARRDASTFAAVSKQMRKTVVGDLGGDALRRWRVTFDLKNELLILR
jgi:hypothetical protein